MILENKLLNPTLCFLSIGQNKDVRWEAMPRLVSGEYHQVTILTPKDHHQVSRTHKKNVLTRVPFSAGSHAWSNTLLLPSWSTMFEQGLPYFHFAQGIANYGVAHAVGNFQPNWCKWLQLQVTMKKREKHYFRQRMLILQMVKLSWKRLNELPRIPGSSLVGARIKLSPPDLNSVRRRVGEYF